MRSSTARSVGPRSTAERAGMTADARTVTCAAAARGAKSSVKFLIDARAPGKRMSLGCETYSKAVAGGVKYIDRYKEMQGMLSYSCFA